MATIAKFYLHDAASPNTGIMPSNSPIAWFQTATGDATGATTARDATDVIGTANPDIESTITSNADTNTQNWGHRRFVSRPLAAQSIPFNTPISWHFSYARTESNLNHNQSIRCQVYAWRPSTGARVGSASTNIVEFDGAEPTVAAAEQVENITGLIGSVSLSIQNGDILVFDVGTVFTQGMATAYTESFAYDGTTEASTTTCASFVTPPSALTLAAATTPSLVYADQRITRNSLLRR